MIDSFTKKIRYFRSSICFLIFAVSCVAFFAQLYLIYDLETFEYPLLFSMIGAEGIVTVLFLNSGLLFFTLKILKGKPVLHHQSKLSIVFICTWAVFILWFIDWIFIATPFTLPAQLWFDRKSPSVNLYIKEEMNSLSNFTNRPELIKADEIEIILKRIRLNNPSMYIRDSICSTIEKYSLKYKVDPVLIFYLNYIDSFYGNAVAGPVPFFKHVNPETFRDLIQVHLPTWVVESSVREKLAQARIYRKILGPAIGMKVNYLFHKLTLDVSLAPYALNIFSDVLLVMKEYPEEFPELGRTDPENKLDAALRDSYKEIAPTALLRPYEQPYVQIPFKQEYYDAHRKNLKKFARAVFCKLFLDFDFATRIQVLFVNYNKKVIIDKIGAESWLKITKSQQLSLLAMPRDLFVPNVGHLGYNLYALPEINCTTIEFVAEELKRDLAIIDSKREIWRPHEPDKLWAGAGYRLRVFGEVWSAFYGKPLPGIFPTNTINAVPCRKR